MCSSSLISVGGIHDRIRGLWSHSSPVSSNSRSLIRFCVGVYVSNRGQTGVQIIQSSSDCSGTNITNRNNVLTHPLKNITYFFKVDGCA